MLREILSGMWDELSFWKKKPKDYPEAIYFPQPILGPNKVDYEWRIACPRCRIRNEIDNRGNTTKMWLFPTEEDVTLWRCWNCGKYFRVTSGYPLPDLLVEEREEVR